jgi:hypothetical protein
MEKNNNVYLSKFNEASINQFWALLFMAFPPNIMYYNFPYFL